MEQYRGLSIKGFVYGDLIETLPNKVDNEHSSWIKPRTYLGLGAISTATENFIRVSSETVCKFVRKDQNGKDIYTTDRIKFRLKKDNKRIELKGSFCWNDDELRYEIDIYEHDDYICLFYDCLKMINFKLLENKT